MWEVLDVDRVVLAHQAQCLLVVVIPPRAGHLAVLDSDLAARLGPVLPALRAAGFLPFPTPQRPQLAGKMLPVRDAQPGAIRRRDARQPGDPHVDARLPLHRRQRCRRHLDHDAGVA
jgi:hypothetical protein